ncbi:uncharacterized protein PHALS_04074 [Plasmopara halstedii]|uniref:Uncharacterized protein n=1 Tax=Plasmopara halstedii TaxID=4781 RepID=A0A0P1A9C0_PLAHL|nr:uncharacterized protein PHALS_04074 [Plasmopara halstedii]CEG36817.1 hypothetical protein PHALS_04074 [Plasmopara halstedii]|eukprot:XP_024573186.1 hypothetical protein PHALS_04074 [Plasmopara halstedii]
MKLKLGQMVYVAEYGLLDAYDVIMGDDLLDELPTIALNTIPVAAAMTSRSKRANASEVR